MPNNINKVVFGNDTLIDLTNDSVSADNLLEGETAHDRSGSPVVGTAKQGHVIKDQDGTSMTQRTNLKFEGGFNVGDDSQNNTTKVQKDIPITWDEWLQLTEQEAEGKDYYITDEPYVNGKINTEVFTKLWENPNPTSAFAAQNITLASDDYDFLIAEFKYVTNINLIVNSIIVSKGESIIFDNGWADASTPYAGVIQRSLGRVSDTVYQVSNATMFKASTGYNTDNTLAIPVAIYGFKKNIEFDLTALVANVSTDASKCIYDNTNSGLEATNVQDAIDEVAGKGVVKSATFSGTTDSNGELVTSIKYKDGVTAVANHGISVYFQIRRSSSNYIVVRATGATGQAVASSLVEGTFYYIED